MKSRREFLVPLLLAVVLLVSAACGPAATTIAPTEEPAVEPTSPPAVVIETEEIEPTAVPEPITLIIAQDADISPSLDIHDARNLQTGISLGMTVFDTLIQLGPEGYESRLAESWEPAEDGWIFHLRDNVVFHDGTPFNAEAVKYNVERLINADLGLRQTSKWKGVEGAEVIDEFTVKILTGGKPSVAFLGQLVHASGGAMQSPIAMENGEFPVGTGPFRLVEWKQDEELILEKNEYYWMDGPFVDRVVIKVVPEASTRVLMLEAGEADFIVFPPPADAQRLAAKEGITIYNPVDGGWRAIGMNYQIEPFTDIRVRQALNYAVDAGSIASRVLFDYAKPLTSPYGSGMWGHVDVGPYPYDPDKARELLTEAGYPDGFETTLHVGVGHQPEGVAVAQAVQAYLKEVGVDVEIVVLEFGVMLDEMSKPLEENTLEMHQLSYGGADLDTLRIMLGCDQWAPRRNRVFYCNEQVDQLFQEGAYEADPLQRVEIYKEIQEIVWDDAPWIFLTEKMMIFALSDRVVDLVTYQANQNYWDLRWVKIIP